MQKFITNLCQVSTLRALLVVLSAFGLTIEIEHETIAAVIEILSTMGLGGYMVHNTVTNKP